MASFYCENAQLTPTVLFPVFQQLFTPAIIYFLAV